MDSSPKVKISPIYYSPRIDRGSGDIFVKHVTVLEFYRGNANYTHWMPTVGMDYNKQQQKNTTCLYAASILSSKCPESAAVQFD